MPTKHDTKGRVLVIVEETVQRAYLLDPADEKTGPRLSTLKGVLTGQLVDPGALFYRNNHAPALIDQRGKKGAIPIRDQQVLPTLPDEDWTRFTGLTIVYPDEDGNPAMEQKVTTQTISQKPVRK